MDTDAGSVRSHAIVSDASNDALRVDGTHLDGTHLNGTQFNGTHKPSGKNVASETTSQQTHHSYVDSVEAESEPDLAPVLKIAHVGDCMGMLVRGEEIVWRSEEMWWGFNTPVQLGPSSPITPAHLSSSHISSASSSSSASSKPSSRLSSLFSPIPTSPLSSLSPRISSSLPSAHPPSTSTASSQHSTANLASTSHLTPSVHLFTLPVRANDILIRASDGLSDNLWDKDISEEVRFVRAEYLGSSTTSPTSPAAQSESTNPSSGSSSSRSSEEEASPSHLKQSSPSSHTPTGPTAAASRLLWRRSLASTLSEALCSRARRVSERRGPVSRGSTSIKTDDSSHSQNGAKESEDARREERRASTGDAKGVVDGEVEGAEEEIDPDETPFGRRTREEGRAFRGGKNDDISVVVAVISPVADLSTSSTLSALSALSGTPATWL